MVSATPRGDLAAPSGAKRPRNPTLLVWSASAGPPEHVNGERDVLMFVAGGSATVNVDGEERELAAGEALIVGKGRRRKTAGPGGLRYLYLHLRRPPLGIRLASERAKREARGTSARTARDDQPPRRRVAEVGRSPLGTRAREELSRLRAAIPESCSGTVTGAQVPSRGAGGGRRRS
jgi:hypothetical protein